MKATNQELRFDASKEELMSRTNVRFAPCLTLICWIAAVVPASAQQLFLPSGSPSLSYIAAGHSEVWGLQFPGGLIYRLNPSTGSWQQISGSLSQIAVGGGISGLQDQVWGVNGAGVFSFNLSTNGYTQHNPSNAATYFNHIAVGEGDLDACHVYEVWGLASSVPASAGLPYRYNFCQGQFVLIPLPSGSTTPFTSIATAPRGSDVWALDADARIWHLNPCVCSWTQIPGSLQQITVGVNDVWGINALGYVYRYDPNNGDFYEYGAGFTQIAAGGDGVWAIQGSGSYNTLRFDSLANQFVTSSGSFMTQVAVGSGAGVWALGQGPSNAYIYVP
jgi:hypothetical protein